MYFSRLTSASTRNSSTEPERLAAAFDAADAVLVGADEWSAIEETLYLMGIPGMAQSLIDGRDTPPIEECVDETALEW